jgi:hypothetical protein
LIFRKAQFTPLLGIVILSITKDRHKLSPLWEGPYIIAQIMHSGAYRLKDSDGNLLTNTWNIENLRIFYS